MEAVKTGNMEDLFIHLELDPKTVQPDQMPDATVVITNEGRDRLLMNARMLLVPEGSPEEFGEIEFWIDGPPESLNLKIFNVNAGSARAENFVLLMPGESMVRTYSLNKYYQYEDPGLYTVNVTYRNKVDVSNGDVSSWKGSLVSNKAKFEIIG